MTLPAVAVMLLSAAFVLVMLVLARPPTVRAVIGAGVASLVAVNVTCVPSGVGAEPVIVTVAVPITAALPSAAALTRIDRQHDTCHRRRPCRRCEVHRLRLRRNAPRRGRRAAIAHGLLLVMLVVAMPFTVRPSKVRKAWQGCWPRMSPQCHPSRASYRRP